MKKRIKNMWLKALRSGHYDQGRNALCTQDVEGYKFCCLGVLTDLAVKDGVDVEWDESQLITITGHEIVIRAGDPLSAEEAYLPRKVMEWAGLDSSDPRTGGAGKALSEYNDNGRSFKQIANIIERHF